MNTISIIEHKMTNLAGFEGEHSAILEPNLPTVILGINGAGKTSLLNSIHSSIIAIIKNLTSVQKNDSQLSGPSVTINKLQSVSISSFHIKSKSAIEDLEIGIRCHLNGTLDIIGVDAPKIANKIKVIYENNSTSLPVFRYFLADKLINNAQSIVKSQTFNTIESRTAGYNKQASNRLSMQEVTNFIITQINIENQLKIEKEDLGYVTPIGQYIKETLSLFTKTLYGENVEVLIGSSKYSSGQSLIIKKKAERLEFIQLSSGEKYIIAVVLELIYRNATLNPQISNFKDTTGIILIDEIESHLHPRWQLTILKALHLCFPKFQFIVSTHSPLVASSVRKNQIIALSNFEIIPSGELPDIYSGTSDEMLRGILFSDIQIDDFDAKRKEIDILINQLNFDAAEEKLENLKKLLKSNPKWIKDYERKISFAQA